MKIELISFVFGAVLAVAVIIVVEHVYGKIFGNNKVHKLEREVKRLSKIVQKKDELIKKSLLEMQERESDNDG